MEENITNIQEKQVDSKKKIKMSSWKIATFVLVGLLIISLFTNGLSFTGASVKDIGESKVSERVNAFIQNNLLGQGFEAKIDSITEEKGLYKFAITVTSEGEEQKVDSYATKDGSLFFVQGLAITEEEKANSTTTTTTTLQQSLPKSDKPIVEAFVMSHCPYGTQIEKGLLPVIELLGNKIDYKIRFVYYAMHGQKELNEELTQYCIQKEQNSKFLDYLTCFLEDGDSERCLTETNIDKVKLNTCVAAADEEFKVTELYNDKSTWLSGNFPLFNVDKALNDKYDVQGSPTLIINGVSSRSGRDSASLLKAVCGAFNEEPSECEEVLSSETPSSGFGFSGSGAATTASCS